MARSATIKPSTGAASKAASAALAAPKAKRLTSDPDFRSLKEKVADTAKRLNKLEAQAAKAERFIIQREWTGKVLATAWTVMVAVVSVAITLLVKW